MLEKEFSKILKTTKAHETTTFEITANKNCKISELLVLLPETLQPGDIIRINALANTTLELDIDMTDRKYSGVHVKLIGGKMEVSPNKLSFTIVTDGLNGFPHAQPKAKKGADGDKKDLNGKDGSDGLSGLPGGNGGDIYIEANQLPIEKIIISAKGGKGGPGQAGGDGGNGANGADGADGTQAGAKQVMLARIKDNKVGYGYYNYYSGVAADIGNLGSVGGNGGNTGHAGSGGLPGQGGNITLIVCGKTPIKRETSPGEHGLAGNNSQSIPGTAGHNGRRGLTCIIQADLIRCYSIDGTSTEYHTNYFMSACNDIETQLLPGKGVYFGNVDSVKESHKLHRFKDAIIFKHDHTNYDWCGWSKVGCTSNFTKNTDSLREQSRNTGHAKARAGVRQGIKNSQLQQTKNTKSEFSINTTNMKSQAHDIVKDGCVPEVIETWFDNLCVMPFKKNMGTIKTTEETIHLTSNNLCPLTLEETKLIIRYMFPEYSVHRILQWLDAYFDVQQILENLSCFDGNLNDLEWQVLKGLFEDNIAQCFPWLKDCLSNPLWTKLSSDKINIDLFSVLYNKINYDYQFENCYLYVNITKDEKNKLLTSVLLNEILDLISSGNFSDEIIQHYNLTAQLAQAPLQGWQEIIAKVRLSLRFTKAVEHINQKYPDKSNLCLHYLNNLRLRLPQKDFENIFKDVCECLKANPKETVCDDIAKLLSAIIEGYNISPNKLFHFFSIIKDGRKDYFPSILNDLVQKEQIQLSKPSTIPKNCEELFEEFSSKSENSTLKEVLGEDFIKLLKLRLQKIKIILEQKIKELKSKGCTPSNWLNDWSSLDIENKVATLACLWHQATEGKQIPRISQLFALLLFIEADKQQKSLLSQIKTGEGKTIIVGLWAAYLSMEGYKVDVITSNNDLAKDGTEKCQKFFSLLNLRSNHNDHVKQEDKKTAYQNHIVYGEISKFQGDILESEFRGKGITGKRYQNMKKVYLIVDEVDSMCLDKASDILYLLHEIESLKSLESLFMIIWLTVLADNGQEGTALDESVSCLEAHFIKQIQDKQISIPDNLHAYVKMKLPIWIESAFQAKVMQINKDFILETVQDDKYGSYKKIIVMDNQVGAELHHTRWNNGLAQFLELKYRRRLSGESLKAVFMSNKSFFDRYGARLFGTTGTLGDSNEKALLHKTYNVNYAIVPAAFEKHFYFKPPQASLTKEKWLEDIKNSILREQFLGRPILIIMEDVAEAAWLHKEIAQHLNNVNLHPYWKEEHTLEWFDNNPARGGDVIIASNKGGRGTDIEVYEECNKKLGGLHVALSYVPENERLVEQALGRSGRNGNPGTGEFIIQASPALINRLKLDSFCDAEIQERWPVLAPLLLEQEKQRKRALAQSRLHKAQRIGLPKSDLERDLLNQFKKLSEEKLKILPLPIDPYLNELKQNGPRALVKLIKGGYEECKKHGLFYRALDAIGGYSYVKNQLSTNEIDQKLIQKMFKRDLEQFILICLQDHWAFWLDEIEPRLNNPETPGLRQELENELAEAFKKWSSVEQPNNTIEDIIEFATLPEQKHFLGELFLRHGQKDLAKTCYEKAKQRDTTGAASLYLAYCEIPVNGGKAENDKALKKIVRHHLKQASFKLQIQYDQLNVNRVFAEKLTGKSDYFPEMAQYIEPKENLTVEQLESKMEVIEEHLKTIKKLVGRCLESSYVFANHSQDMVEQLQSENIYLELINGNIIYHNRIRREYISQRKLKESAINYIKQSFTENIANEIIKLLNQQLDSNHIPTAKFISISPGKEEFLGIVELAWGKKKSNMDSIIIIENDNGFQERLENAINQHGKLIYKNVTFDWIGEDLYGCYRSVLNNTPEICFKFAEIVNDKLHINLEAIPFESQSLEAQKIINELHYSHILKSGGLALKHNSDVNQSKYAWKDFKGFLEKKVSGNAKPHIDTIFSLQGDIRSFRDGLKGWLKTYYELTNNDLASQGVISLPKELDFYTKMGLHRILVLEEDQRYRFNWGALAIFFIGFAQALMGCVLCACGFANIGNALISEGISDMIQGTMGMISGELDWAEWGIAKGISLAISLLTAGLSSLKTAMKETTNITKNLSKLDKLKKAITHASKASKVADLSKAQVFVKTAARASVEFTLELGVELACNYGLKELMSTVQKGLYEKLTPTIQDKLNTKKILEKLLEIRAKKGTLAYEEALHIFKVQTLKITEILENESYQTIFRTIQQAFQGVLSTYQSVKAAGNSGSGKIKLAKHAKNQGMKLALDAAINSIKTTHIMALMSTLNEGFSKQVLGEIDETMDRKFPDLLRQQVLQEHDKDAAKNSVDEITNKACAILGSSICDIISATTSGAIKACTSYGIAKTAEHIDHKFETRFKLKNASNERAVARLNPTPAGNKEHQVQSTLEHDVISPEKIKAYLRLGLKPGASDNEIKKAFQKLYLENHPDKGGIVTRQKFEEVIAARDALIPPKQIQYDEQRLNPEREKKSSNEPSTPHTDNFQLIAKKRERNGSSDVGDTSVAKATDAKVTFFPKKQNQQYSRNMKKFNEIKGHDFHPDGRSATEECLINKPQLRRRANSFSGISDEITVKQRLFFFENCPPNLDNPRRSFRLMKQIEQNQLKVPSEAVGLYIRGDEVRKVQNPDGSKMLKQNSQTIDSKSVTTDQAVASRMNEYLEKSVGERKEMPGLSDDVKKLFKNTPYQAGYFSSVIETYANNKIRPQYVLASIHNMDGTGPRTEPAIPHGGIDSTRDDRGHLVPQKGTYHSQVDWPHNIIAENWVINQKYKTCFERFAKSLSSDKKVRTLHVPIYTSKKGDNHSNRERPKAVIHYLEVNGIVVAAITLKNSKHILETRPGVTDSSTKRSSDVTDTNNGKRFKNR